MFSTKLVLPIDGRAATITRSDFWKPGRHLVEIDEAARHAGDEPLVLLQLLDRREAALHELAERHEARRASGPRRSGRSARSASSSSRSGSSSASYASDRILFAEWISLRSVDFSLTIRA